MAIPIRQYWALLHRYLKPQWQQAGLLAVLILTHIGLRLINPQITRFFIDTAVTGGSIQTLLKTAVLFLGVAVVIQVLSVANTYIGEHVAWKATNALRLDLLLHCLQLDPSFHKKHTAGSLLERIDGDVNALSNFFSRLIIYVVGNGLLMMGVLIFLFREEWRVGLGVSLFALPGLVIMLRVRTIAVPYWTEVRQYSADFYGFLGEQLAGTEDIRANGARGYVLSRFDRLTQSWFAVRLRANMTGSLMWSVSILVFAIGTATAFGLSAYLWQQEAISIGTIYLIFYYTDLLRQPMSELRNQIESLQQAEASITRIQMMLATESKLLDGHQTLPPGKMLSVALDKVSFYYADEEEDSPAEPVMVLQDVSFKLAAGRVLGLLGRTGSGKTTLARLLLRLYDPVQGHIYLDGQAPADLSLANLRQCVRLVTQDIQLFQATIRDNLTFFNPQVADAQITAVLTDLGLASWLAAQPQGLDTQLETEGSSLSAGQAQLMAFARVFLADPGLVILDEASSRLDPATEQLIERAVDKLLQNRTGIIIAHHLATVERADDILILENGRILEYGPRLALLQNPASHFYQLWQTGLQEVLA